MKIDKSELRIRPGFIVGLFVVFIVLPAFLPVGEVGGKPTARGLACLACRDFVRYAKSASINGEFTGDFSKLPEPGLWERGDTTYVLTPDLTNKSPLEAVRMRGELYNSPRAIFNTNQNFWAKTNFIFNASISEPVIVCKRQFYLLFGKNLFGCSFGWHKPVFAVGYPDETVKLISKREFNRLDLRGFVPLSSLGIQGFRVNFVTQGDHKIIE